MKEIMHTYGALITSAAILVGILALFSNVSYRAAAAFENKEILDDNMQNIAYDNYKNVHIPKLTPKPALYETSRDIIAGNLFCDTAESANILRTKAYTVLDESGNRKDECIKNSGMRLYFAKPGIYTVYLTVTMVNGMQLHSVTKVAVNQKI